MEATLNEKRPRFDLLESNANSKGHGKPGGFLMSLVIHGLVIVGAVIATVHGAPQRIKDKIADEKLVYVKPDQPKPEAPKVEAPQAPKKVFVAPKPRVSAPVVPAIVMPVAPINIPTEIPKVDPNAVATIEPATGIGGTRGNEVPGGNNPGPVSSGGDNNRTWSESEVEEPARPAGGAPEYPSNLQSSGVEGSVKTQFVIGPNGRVEEGSIKILDSSNDGFSRSVRIYLGRARYRPGKVGGKAVRQIVEQTFSFRLGR